jgi:hypothetical protein
LALEAVRSKFGAIENVVLCMSCILLSEVRKREKDLDNRVEIARVSKVLHSSVKGPKDWDKSLSFFDDLR